MNYLAREEPSLDVVQHLLVSSGECGRKVFSALFGKWLKLHRQKLTIILGQIISKSTKVSHKMKQKRNEITTEEDPVVFEIVKNLADHFDREKDSSQEIWETLTPFPFRVIDKRCSESTKKLFPKLFEAINNNVNDFKPKARGNSSGCGEPETHKFEDSIFGVKSEARKLKRSSEADMNKEKHFKKKKETWFFQK